MLKYKESISSRKENSISPYELTQGKKEFVEYIMNYLIQRGKVRNQMINVPQGLPELLSDITREVLRCQPTTECLCQFVIDYLHSLIETREKIRVAKGIIDRALAVVDEIIADMCVCDISKEKAQEMAMHMEECFRRFLSRMRCEQRKDIEVVRFEEQDMLNLMIERCKFTEQELKISKPMIEAAYRRFVEAYIKAYEDFEGTEELYQYFKEREHKRQEEEKAKMAATKIQANFRGYRVRRNLDKPQRKDISQENFDEGDLELQTQAAITIQKAFRRHLSSLEAKKSIEKGGEVCEPGSEVKVTTHGTISEDITEPPGHIISEVWPLEPTQPSQTPTEVVPEVTQEPASIAEQEPEPIHEPEPDPEPEPEPTLEVEPEQIAQEPEHTEVPLALEKPALETTNDANEGEALAEG